MYAKFINFLVFLVSVALIASGIVLVLLPIISVEEIKVPETSIWPLTIVGIVAISCGVLLLIASAILAVRMSRDHHRSG